MENKTSKIKQGLISLIGEVALVVGISSLAGCNPIDLYRTISIRYEESDMYEKYKKIDMSKLTDAEKEHLKEMHETYGNGAIEVTKLSNGLDEDIIKSLTYLTGHKRFTDKDLVFIYRSSGELAGAIMPTPK